MSENINENLIPEDNYPKILIGDVRDKLTELPDKCINTIVTSPPYWQQRDYNDDEQIGQEEEVEMYIKEIVDIGNSIRRILSDDGVYFLNIGDKYIDKDKQMIPYKVVNRMKKNGWAVRNIISWYKPNHMPSSIQDRFTNTWEPIFMLVKDDSDYYMPPKYYFNIDAIRIPHKTEGTELPELKKVLDKDEYSNLPTKFIDNKTIPYSISKETYDKLPSRFKSEGDTEYDGKFDGEDNINKGQSPGARQSVDGLYYTKQRKNNPDDDLIVKYLRNKKDETDLTISDIDDHFGYNYTAGHWFRLDEGGRSLPSPEDWWELKKLLDLDDRFDNEMTEIHYVLQGVRKHPKGKNPGDMWKMATANLSEAHFAPFPEELPRKCIKATCPEDGIVLDPFAGSGTTGKVALELGVKSIMIDINKEYKQIMNERFKNIE